MTARDNLRTKRRRRKRQEARPRRRRRPILLMKRETSTAWTALVPGRGELIIRYMSDGKPHVSSVFVYPDGPL